MNFFTAIVAFPLFSLIFLFEAWLVKNHVYKCEPGNRILVKACLVVSLLQMVSCWFWLGGFIFSETRNDAGEWETGLGSVLSEAMEDNERMNCFGLVGAEMILAVFQWIFSVLVCYQAMLMREIASGKLQQMKGLQSGGKGIVVLTAVVLGFYTGVAWVTAYNRRCPQNAFEFRFQHYFYPVYLVVDLFYSSVQNMACKKIGFLMSETWDSDEAGLTSQQKDARAKIKTFQMFFAYLGIASFAACMFAIAVFIGQFYFKLWILRFLACVFCVIMYVFYAARRVPTIMLYCKFQPFLDIMAVRGRNHATIAGIKTLSVIDDTSVLSDGTDSSSGSASGSQSADAENTSTSTESSSTANSSSI